MNTDKQNLFDEMEKVYGNRAFVTKHPDMFRAILHRIAQRYKEQGVQYATLFDAGIITNMDRVRDLHRFLPAIEKETGVKIRFLASLWRHSDLEWNEDEVSRLLPLLKSPYIIGVDVMGDETNPIRDLKTPLTRLIKYAREHVPYFHMHIHGGENPYYSCDPKRLSKWDHNNVHEGLQIVDDALRNIEREYDENGKIIIASGSEDSPIQGKYCDQLKVIMGHGRYGLYDETLALMKRIGAISNKCLSSNYLLAFAKDLRKTFHNFVENDIPACIATDGYGMYGTSIPRELAVAREYGLSDKDLEHVQRSEMALLEEEDARFAAKIAIWKQYEATCKARGVDPFNQMAEDAVYTGPDGTPHHTKDTAATKKESTQNHIKHLFDGLHALGISTNETEIHALLENKKIIGFFGGSKGWDDEKRQVSEENVIKTEQALRALIFSIDGSTHAFMTGGTDFGFEKIVHALTEERNAQLPPNKKNPGHRAHDP
ncbi:MAG: hypothetical protein LRY62_00985 [Alphaproteobacteria bacterium]|nr:hypothetical protein [Alphaproteobacteria bacterium]